MPEYITVEEAYVRLSRYSGITVPSNVASGSPAIIPLQIYVDDANDAIEAFLGHPYLETQYEDSLEGVVQIDKAGQGKIRIVHETKFPLTAIISFSIPDEARWTGGDITLTDAAWDKTGHINLAFTLPAFSEVGWRNPLRVQPPEPALGLKMYPDVIKVDFTAGFEDVPLVFKRVCVQLIVLQLLEESDPTMTTHKRMAMALGPQKYDEEFRENPREIILEQLDCYKLA